MSDASPPAETVEIFVAPPTPAPCIATLRGISRWDAGTHVFVKDVPRTIPDSLREYLEKAAPGLFEFQPLYTLTDK